MSLRPPTFTTCLQLIRPEKRAAKPDLMEKFSLSEKGKKQQISKSLAMQTTAPAKRSIHAAPLSRKLCFVGKGR